MRGNGRIFARKGSSSLWIAYYLRGKEYRESTGNADPKEAAKFLRRRLREVGADQIGARTFGGPQQERVTVTEILERLTVTYKRGRRGLPREVSPQMRSHLNRVEEYFGAMRAMQVHDEHVHGFIATLKAEGKQNATINRSLQLLGQAYKLAVTSDPPMLPRTLRVPKLEENNIRKGKFSNDEAEAIFAGLPDYMSGVARFAYETGARAGEILKMEWSYLSRDAIAVPATNTKSRKPRSIALTPRLEEIIRLRRAARIPGCEFIFHNQGHAIRDYRKCWHTVCVMIGLGKFYCRNCRDKEHAFISALDAEKKCPKCEKKWEVPKYIGTLFHDFRRTAAHELWKAGNTAEDCMEVTGHATPAMFKRYADLFTEEEKQARQRAVQKRRLAWREAQLENLRVMPTALRQ